MSEERDYVRWAEVERDAVPLFSIWTDHPEMQWARAAWERLERAGLTRATNEVERAVVMVRLVALAALYHGFAAKAWEEGDAQPEYWADEVGIRKARLLQCLGPDFDVDAAFEDQELLRFAFAEVYDAEYGKVAAAVIEGFGGVPRAFAALWLSRNGDWSGRTDVPDDLLNEVLNEHTFEKEAAYAWLTDQSR